MGLHGSQSLAALSVGKYFKKIKLKEYTINFLILSWSIVILFEIFFKQLGTMYSPKSLNRKNNFSPTHNYHYFNDGSGRDSYIK